MKKVILLISIIILIIPAFSACATSSGGERSVTIACTDLYYQKNVSRQIEVSSGDTLVVTLCSNPSANSFNWQETPEISAKTIVQKDHKLYPPATSDPKDPSGKEVWTFQVNGKGVNTIKFTYNRPWEGTQSQGIFTLTINIK
jgi:predicted secreted protein